jgi:hypothetical protein
MLANFATSCNEIINNAMALLGLSALFLGNLSGGGIILLWL